MQVRRATPADVEGIVALLQEAFREHAERFTPEAYRFATPGPAVVAARLQEGPIWVAEAPSQLLGTVSGVVDERGFYVRQMGVAMEARGKRVGHALMDALEAHAATLDVPCLHLSTTPFMDAAIRLYERRGFVRVAGGPQDLFGTPLFTMEKRRMDRTPM